MLLVAGVLLTVYFILDSFYYRREPSAPAATREKTPLRLEGAHNFIFLAGIVGAVLFSGVVKLGDIELFGVHRSVQDYFRDMLLIIMGLMSMVSTSIETRERNEFTWFPIIEVGLLFIGIFITMLPCLLILKAGDKGALAFLMEAIQEPYHYFWAAGLLSSFLDNAPTYLTFFNTAIGCFAAGLPEPAAVGRMMGERQIYLQAISTGAVFFGACTYIGNAPNFMVRSIAEEAGTPMPSFFGYILKYTLVFLVPCFVLVSVIFF